MEYSAQFFCRVSPEHLGANASRWELLGVLVCFLFEMGSKVTSWGEGKKRWRQEKREDNTKVFFSRTVEEKMH